MIIKVKNEEVAEVELNSHHVRALELGAEVLSAGSAWGDGAQGAHLVVRFCGRTISWNWIF